MPVLNEYALRSTRLFAVFNIGLVYCLHALSDSHTHTHTINVEYISLEDQEISVAGHKNASWRNKKVWRKREKKSTTRQMHLSLLTLC